MVPAVLRHRRWGDIPMAPSVGAPSVGTGYPIVRSVLEPRCGTHATSPTVRKAERRSSELDARQLPVGRPGCDRDGAGPTELACPSRG
jgi:hypothetical protein